MVSSYKVTTCYQMVKWECLDMEHGCIWGLKSLWTGRMITRGLVCFFIYGSLFHNYKCFGSNKKYLEFSICFCI